MRALILLACVAGATAAEAPSPRDTDPVTRRRAEEALADHAAHSTKPTSTADLALLDRFTAVTTMVQEGEGFLAKQLAVEAGERYLAAAERLKGFSPEERQALGERWGALQTAYTALGRKLADSDGLEKAAAAAAIAQPDGANR